MMRWAANRFDSGERSVLGAGRLERADAAQHLDQGSSATRSGPPGLAGTSPYRRRFSASSSPTLTGGQRQDEQAEERRLKVPEPPGRRPPGRRRGRREGLAGHASRMIVLLLSRASRSPVLRPWKNEFGSVRTCSTKPRIIRVSSRAAVDQHRRAHVAGHRLGPDDDQHAEAEDRHEPVELGRHDLVDQRPG